MVESGEPAGPTDAGPIDAAATGAAPHPALARLRAAVDEVLAIELTPLGRDDLLAVVRDLEIQKRRLPITGWSPNSSRAAPASNCASRPPPGWCSPCCS